MVLFVLFGQNGLANTNNWYDNTPTRLTLYPNPATNMISLTYQASSDYTIVISNILGTVVYKSKTISSFQETNILYLQDLKVQSGLYLVKIFVGDKLDATKKLVVRSS